MRKRKANPFPKPFTASDALDAVERWSEGYAMLRETGAVLDAGPWSQRGRMDAVLIPRHWDAASYKKLKFGQGLTAIEVKLSKSDFERGRSEQFQRYAEVVSGLYICTAAGVCKTKDIDREYGHLVVAQRDCGFGKGYYLTCVCKRHPRWKDVELDQVQLWRVLWAFGKWFDEARDKERERVAETRRRLSDRFHNLMARMEKETRP